jgi:hypothetical protein
MLWLEKHRRFTSLRHPLPGSTYLGLNGWLAARWFDPSCDRLCRWFGLLSDKAFGGSAEGAVECGLAGGVDLVGLTAVHLVGASSGRCQRGDGPDCTNRRSPAERFGVLNATESLRKLRPVFHGFEVAFRERIVIGGVRPAVGFGDAEIGKQQGRGLGSHRTAAIGMQGELAFRRGMFGGGVLE